MQHVIQAYAHAKRISWFLIALPLLYWGSVDTETQHDSENVDLTDLCIVRKKGTHIGENDTGISFNISSRAEFLAIKRISAEMISRVQVDLAVDTFSSESDWESADKKKHKEPFGVAVSFGKSIKRKCPNKVIFFIRQVLFYRLNKNKHPRTIVFFLAQNEPHLKLYTSPTFPGRLFYCAYRIPEESQQVSLDIDLQNIAYQAFGEDSLRVNALSLVSDLRDVNAQIDLTVEQITLLR